MNEWVKSLEKIYFFIFLFLIDFFLDFSETRHVMKYKTNFNDLTVSHELSLVVWIYHLNIPLSIVTRFIQIRWTHLVAIATFRGKVLSRLGNKTLTYVDVDTLLTL